MILASLQALLLAGSLQAIPAGSVVTARVVEVSPGWSCAALDSELRAFERRVRVSFLGMQRPHDVYSGSATRPPRIPGARVPDDVQLAAWREWKSPVTIEVLLPSRLTDPPETVLTEPEAHSNVTIAASSGTSHVDASAVFSVVGSGRQALLGGCRRNFWRLHVTFSPPVLPVDVRIDELRHGLADADAWVRVLAAHELLRLDASVDAARSVLEGALHDEDESVRTLAAAFLQESRR